MKDENPGSPIGIVLLNMGGPDSLEAVKPFLYNLFADRDLIQLPLGALLQKPFARLISHFRAKKVVENYRAIGGKTPLLHWTQRQAEGIAARLGATYRPYVAMRYWHPRADETLAQMAADGVQRAVVLSMYPHYTGATTGSSVKDFQRAAAAKHPALKYRVIEQWYDWPGYLDALAQCVRAGLEKFSEDLRPQVQILFSAHALPQKFIDRGDPYLEHVLDTARGVMKRIGNRSWRMGFQSRSGPVKWMEPDTVEVIDQLAAEGRPAVLLVPISFVSDHIETLHEIDIEYREHARAQGIVHFERSPSLNEQPEFLAGMADLVSNELENWR
ncbi:ferrochelatase [Geoalkalibacter ferrihydriticus]|uniref:Ferrochelatase n=2 Tax=Geoalkalibacter ferrihydriticus TaxID=392333 RepID=A0A0C2HTP4_9BACT|nr:ferrochelatase [Geoalkalibacter ferrihydriticus]KIH76207.1 ferrochelatase [Geoalkalibacter ferrihydriticus DSM 17813]SDL27284.1 ferrochelatase [Geoalkalibacter ferrihydriticus]